MWHICDMPHFHFLYVIHMRHESSITCHDSCIRDMPHWRATWLIDTSYVTAIRHSNTSQQYVTAIRHSNTSQQYASLELSWNLCIRGAVCYHTVYQKRLNQSLFAKDPYLFVSPQERRSSHSFTSLSSHIWKKASFALKLREKSLNHIQVS